MEMLITATLTCLIISPQHLVVKQCESKQATYLCLRAVVPLALSRITPRIVTYPPRIVTYHCDLQPDLWVDHAAAHGDIRHSTDMATVWHSCPFRKPWPAGEICGPRTVSLLPSFMEDKHSVRSNNIHVRSDGCL